MHIEKLAIASFKNHSNTTYEFCPGINCIFGPNGVGKTNVLDAIYFLGNGRSYFTRHDRQSIPFGSAFARFEGEFIHDQRRSTHTVVLRDNGKKTIEHTGSVLAKLSDLVGHVPVVIITPGDINLINGHSDERRRFIDRAIALLDSSYIKNLQRHNRLLLLRNEMLKKFALDRHTDDVALEGIDTQFIPQGDAIHERRTKFCSELVGEVSEIYQLLSNSRESVTMKYVSPLDGLTMSEVLRSNRQTDLYAQRTSNGIHRDDIQFSLGDLEVKNYASQGQIKTLTISLHLAIFKIISRQMSLTPVLLLDDIYEKIDDERADKLMSLIATNRNGQIFITDTSEGRIRNKLKGINAEKKFFNIERRKDTGNSSTTASD